jgi:hypothetical protein
MKRLDASSVRRLKLKWAFGDPGGTPAFNVLLAFGAE